MITFRGYVMIAINVGRMALVRMYNGAHLVWQRLRSCFGTGVWRNDLPWLNDDKWKNN